MSDLTGINFERLDNAITHGFEHPAEFSMSMWFGRLNGCGTTACLAGTAALQDGWKPDFAQGYLTTGCVERDGKTEHVENVGAALLGLNDDQREIFSAYDIHAVIRRRNRWAREAGIPERTWESA